MYLRKRRRVSPTVCSTSIFPQPSHTVWHITRVHFVPLLCPLLSCSLPKMTVIDQSTVLLSSLLFFSCLSLFADHSCFFALGATCFFHSLLGSHFPLVASEAVTGHWLAMNGKGMAAWLANMTWHDMILPQMSMSDSQQTTRNKGGGSAPVEGEGESQWHEDFIC